MSKPQRQSPYQGLTPYDERDAPYFFGREKETKLIIASLFASPLTLLYGASGVGKSSVLRAGALNALRPRKDLLVLVFNQWQGNSLVELKTFIAKAAAPLIVNKTSLRKFSALKLNRVSLTEFLIACSTFTKRRLMIILDQFEEYSLYHPEDDAFAFELPKAIAVGDLSASFLFSLREDALAGLDRFEGRIPTLFSNFRRIDHLDRAAAKKAITQPIAQYNKLNKLNSDSISIEPDLVEQVLEQVRTGQLHVGETGLGATPISQSSKESRIETPYLQLVMTRLWDHEINAGSRQLTLQTLNTLGGAQRIVLSHLDSVMGKFSEEEKELLARIYNLLVTPSGTKIAHMVRDLADYAGVSSDRLKPILDSLSRGNDRILRPVASLPDYPNEPRYEIFHDRLGAAVLDWRSRYLHEQELIKTKRQEVEQRHFSQSYVDRLMTKLNKEESEWAQQALKFLLTPSGAKIVQRVKDLASYLNTSSSTLEPILDKLSGEEDGILSRVSPPGQLEGSRYEIRHDALAPAILDWRGRYLHDQELEKKKQQQQQQEKEPDQPSTITIRTEAEPPAVSRKTGVPPPYRLINDMLSRGRVVPFLGPGVSVSARKGNERWGKGANFLPTGYELAQALASLTNFPYEDASDRVDLSTVASYVEEVAGRRILVEHLNDALAGGKSQPSEVHMFLAHLAATTPLIIVTSNYDTLMEQALQAEDVAYDVVVNVSQSDREDLAGAVLWWAHGATEPQPMSPNQLSLDVFGRTIVYKIYGSVDRTNIERSSYVITDIDYLESFLKFGPSLLPPLILSELQRKGSLFLGWGSRTWYNRVFLHFLMRARTGAPRSWSFLYRPSLLERSSWEQMDIATYDEELNEFGARIRA